MDELTEEKIRRDEQAIEDFKKSHGFDPSTHTIVKTSVFLLLTPPYPRKLWVVPTEDVTSGIPLNADYIDQHYPSLTLE